MADYNLVKKSFVSKASVSETSGKLGRLLKREPTSDESRYLIQIMGRANLEFYKKYKSISDCQDAIAKYVSMLLLQTEKSYMQYDSEDSDTLTDDNDNIDGIDHDEPIQSILKKEIYNTSDTNTSRTRIDMGWNQQRYEDEKKEFPIIDCNSFLGFDNSFDIVNALNPSSLSRIFPPLTLDSRNRILAEYGAESRTTMQWSFYNSTRFSQGSVNGLGTIRDIIGIECGTIYLPNFDNIAFGEYRQISMFIQEFSEQASIINEKIRYHFLFNAEKVPNDVGTERLKLTPAFSDVAETRFDRPITSLNTLTISFGNPGEKITLGYDRDLSPGAITVGATTTFTTSIPHGMSGGDLVYIENFTVSPAGSDTALISEINKNTGHIVTETTALTFTVDIDTSVWDVGSPPTLSVGSILFGSKRFFIPLKIKYIGGRRDL